MRRTPDRATHAAKMFARRMKQKARQVSAAPPPQKKHPHTRENSRRLRQIAMGMLMPDRMRADAPTPVREG